MLPSSLAERRSISWNCGNRRCFRGYVCPDPARSVAASSPVKGRKQRHAAVRRHTGNPQIVSGSPVPSDLSKALRPARFVVSLFCRWFPPVRDHVQGVSIGRGEGALRCFLTASIQPHCQCLFAGRATEDWHPAFGLVESDDVLKVPPASYCQTRECGGKRRLMLSPDAGIRLAAMARWYLTVVSATPATAAIFAVGIPRLYISTHSGSDAVRFVWVIRLPMASPPGVVLGPSSLPHSAIRSRRNMASGAGSPASDLSEL